MLIKRSEPYFGLAPGFRAAAMHFHVCRNERTHQPRPNGALMVSRIAFPYAAFVMRPVACIIRRQTTQAQRREQLTLYHVDNLPLLVGRQHGVMQAHGKNLIWANRCVASLAIHYVI